MRFVLILPHSSRGDKHPNRPLLIAEIERDPPELVDDMAALALSNDTALWRIARNMLPSSAQERLDLLLDEKGQGTLTVEGQQELDRLLNEYERMVLTRAQAALLLRQRGYDVSDPAVLSKPSVP